MKIEAHRLSGLGNIILLVDLIRQPGEIKSPDIKKIIQGDTVHFDQLITIEPPTEPQMDLSVQIFNNDGSKANNCINGARCLTKYVSDSGLIPQKNSPSTPMEEYGNCQTIKMEASLLKYLHLISHRARKAFQR